MAESTQKRRKTVDTTTLVLVLIAVALLVVAFLRGRELPLAGLRVAGETILRNLPLLLASFVIAGLAQVLIPKDLITSWLGTQAGGKSIFIGCILGGIVPGSPYAAFPVIGALYKGGASLGAVVSFVSAWSLWSVVRLPAEMALIDPKAALVRYGITFIVPPIAGLIALVIARFL
jgi:uncharacterized membrane protein YraQ (UPF0718 family)